MNAYLRLDSVELWHVAGWTMLHFVWLGALVMLVYTSPMLALMIVVLLPLIGPGAAAAGSGGLDLSAIVSLVL